jgi:tape measure domain-containing protein
MPANEDRLLVRLEAQDRQFQQVMRRVNQTLDRSTASNRRMLSQMERDTRAASTRIWAPLGDGLRTQLAGLSGVLAAAFSAQQVLAYADAYTSLQNRFRAIGLEGERLAVVEDRLYEIANRNGIAVDATVQLYQRAAMARDNLGASEEQLLDLVSGTSAALRLQGTSATEASGALLQLGQLLGGQNVQAQEYNSLIDQLPVVLQAVADGSDRWGGSINRLTTDVRAGTVTAREFSDAMLVGFRDVEQRASGAAVTVGSAMQTLNNELGRFVGQTDQGMSATERMAQAILALSQNLDVVVTTVGLAVVMVGSRLVIAQGLASVATVRLTLFQTAMTASMMGTTRAALLATTAMGGLRTAMMFLLTNPFGIAITAVAAAIAILAIRTDEATSASDDFNRSTTALESATEAYAEAARAAAVATGDGAAASLEAAAASRALAAAARDAARSKLAEARATVALIQAEAQRQLDLERRAPIRGDRPGSVRTIGAEARAELRQATTDAAAAASAIAEANSAIAEADALIAAAASAPAGVTPVGAASGSSGGGRGGGGSSGPSAQELRDRRALFELEQDLEIARAAGDERRIASLEDEIALIRLTEQMREIGVENAEAAAGNHIDALRQMATEEARMAVLAAERAKRDDQAAEARERELEAQRQIADAEARRQGEIEDRADSAAQTIVSVLRSDNIWEEAGRRFQDAAWDGVEQLLSQMLQQIIGSISQAGGGGGGGLGSLISAGISAFTGGPAGVKGVGLAPSGAAPIGKDFGAPLGSVIDGMSAKGSDRQAIIVQVVKGEMFDAHVERVAAPMAIQAAQYGAQQGQAGALRTIRRSQQSALGMT